MEKILDYEFRTALYNSLKEAGIKESEIEKIINTKYKHALVNAVRKLIEISDLIKDGEYSSVEAMISYSPAGDGYGCNNYYIDFSDAGLEDIKDVLRVLSDLKAYEYE